MALAAIALVHVVIVWLGDGLFFTSYEADMIHLADLVLRQAGGQVYHLDIATPLGGWTTLPMALLYRLGLGLGSAMVWGQVVVLLALFPALALISLNRLTLRQSITFGVVVLGLCTGLIFGGVEPSTSLSMSYNRWAWAATLIITLAVMLPGQHPQSLTEGLVIGLLMAALAMVKASYAVALALPVIFGLLRNGRSRVLLAALVAALALLGAVTLSEGIGYWRLYLGDLLTVAGSEHRAAPGLDWKALILSPVGLPGTLVIVAMVSGARQAGRTDFGTVLLLFFAAFTYITWQNYGNDPLWLAGLAMVAWVLAGQGGRHPILYGAAIAAVALILPATLNILWSPVRHLSHPESLSRPLFADDDPSLRMATELAASATALIPLIPAPEAEPKVFRDEVLPDCVLNGGLVRTLERDTAELIALAPELDRQPLVADMFQAHWLFADLRPLEKGAPWYYDGLPGLADATHVLVPECPADPRARGRITDLLQAAEVPLEDAGRTDHFRLYRIIR